jgi:hypothetical protein
VVPAALLLGSLGVAASAHADDGDAKFLAGLQAQGITDHVSPAHAIMAAHMVCQQLEDGKSPSDVANAVVESTSMPAFHSGYFVGAAIDAYCPDYKSKLTG